MVRPWPELLLGGSVRVFLCVGPPPGGTPPTGPLPPGGTPPWDTHPLGGNTHWGWGPPLVEGGWGPPGGPPLAPPYRPSGGWEGLSL